MNYSNKENPAIFIFLIFLIDYNYIKISKRIFNPYKEY